MTALLSSVNTDIKVEFFTEGPLNTDNYQSYAQKINARLQKSDITEELKALAELSEMYFTHTDGLREIANLYQQASERSGHPEKYKDKEGLFEMSFHIIREGTTPASMMAQFDEMYMGVMDGLLTTPKDKGSSQIVRSTNISNLRTHFIKNNLRVMKEAILHHAPEDTADEKERKEEAIALIDDLTTKAEKVAALIEANPVLKLKPIKTAVEVRSAALSIPNIDQNVISTLNETGGRLVQRATKAQHEVIGNAIAKRMLPTASFTEQASLAKHINGIFSDHFVNEAKKGGRKSSNNVSNPTPLSYGQAHTALFDTKPSSKPDEKATPEKQKLYYRSALKDLLIAQKEIDAMHDFITQHIDSSSTASTAINAWKRDVDTLVAATKDTALKIQIPERTSVFSSFVEQHPLAEPKPASPPAIETPAEPVVADTTQTNGEIRHTKYDFNPTYAAISLLRQWITNKSDHADITDAYCALTGQNHSSDLKKQLKLLIDGMAAPAEVIAKQPGSNQKTNYLNLQHKASEFINLMTRMAPAFETIPADAKMEIRQKALSFMRWKILAETLQTLVIPLPEATQKAAFSYHKNGADSARQDLEIRLLELSGQSAEARIIARDRAIEKLKEQPTPDYMQTPLSVTPAQDEAQYHRHFDPIFARYEQESIWVQRVSEAESALNNAPTSFEFHGTPRRWIKNQSLAKKELDEAIDKMARLNNYLRHPISLEDGSETTPFNLLISRNMMLLDPNTSQDTINLTTGIVSNTVKPIADSLAILDLRDPSGLHQAISFLNALENTLIGNADGFSTINEADVTPDIRLASGQVDTLAEFIADAREACKMALRTSSPDTPARV